MAGISELPNGPRQMDRPLLGLIASLASDMQQLHIKPEMEISDASMLNNALAPVQNK